MTLAPLPVLTFAPLYRHVVWGGERIASYKGVEAVGDDVGESWEVSALEGQESRILTPGLTQYTLRDLVALDPEGVMGRRTTRAYGTRFPLLVKVIDARSDLSVQVHPDDAMASRLGAPCSKEEAWYCLTPQDGAYLYAGLSRQLDTDTYRRSIADGAIVKAMQRYEIARGDVFHLPGGTIHAIGGGCLLLEVQQSSDITYRIYDWGRGRTLHTQQAEEALFHGATVTPRHEARVAGLPLPAQHFVMEHVCTDGDRMMPLDGRDCFTILHIVDGTLDISDPLGRRTHLTRGHTALIPASMPHISTQGRAEVIAVTLPHHIGR